MRAHLPTLGPATRDLLMELALLPLSIRGYGPVKTANAARAAERRAAILDALAKGGAPQRMAAE